LSDSGRATFLRITFSLDRSKANALQPIPFGNAINFKSNRYLPFAIVPFCFFFFYASGNNAVISQSLNRVVHFNDLLPPAPFKFVLLNGNLQTEQNKDFILRIKTEGKVVPENAMIFIDGRVILWKIVRRVSFSSRLLSGLAM
jgi:hypothetical protein